VVKGTVRVLLLAMTYKRDHGGGMPGEQDKRGRGIEFSLITRKRSSREEKLSRCRVGGSSRAKNERNHGRKMTLGGRGLKRTRKDLQGKPSAVCRKAKWMENHGLKRKGGGVPSALSKEKINVSIGRIEIQNDHCQHRRSYRVFRKGSEEGKNSAPFPQVEGLTLERTGRRANAGSDTSLTRRGMGEIWLYKTGTTGKSVSGDMGRGDPKSEPKKRTQPPWHKSLRRDQDGTGTLGKTIQGGIGKRRGQNRMGDTRNEQI